MSIPMVSIEADLDELYCPFTGNTVGGETADWNLPSVLFVTFGDAGDYAHISEKLVSLLKAKGVNCSTEDLDLDPEEVADKLDLKAAFLLRVDAGWNGVNYYCFCLPD